MYWLASTIIVVLAQFSVISAGWMSPWPTYTSNYSLLAEAFLHGQTSLPIEPDPKLLALPDPYDPVTNLELRHHDISLYNGKYYLYFGPVPAILEAPFVRLLGWPIGDEKIALAFMVGIVLVSGELLLEIRRRLFPDVPMWTVAIGILLAGLATPAPFLLSRAAIYEAAILAGQFFLLAGSYFSIRAFGANRARRVPLLLAGACWAMAVGSRASLVVAIGALVLLVFGALRKTRDAERQTRIVADWMGRAALAGPLVLGAGLLGYYNYVRFGHWYEFGQQYQLAGYNLHRIRDHLFSIANVPPALYSFFLKPVEVSLQFPFFKAVGGAWTYPTWVKLPPDYESLEVVAGIPWSVPFLVFAIVPAIVALRQFARRRHKSAGKLAESPSAIQCRWIATLLFVASAFGFLPVLFLIGSTMRYLADLTPGMIILAVVGLWEAIKTWPAARGRLLFAGAVLSAYSVAVGLLLILHGDYRQLLFYRLPSHTGV